MIGRRRRPLTPEERDLWDKVAESAEPLRPRPKTMPPVVPPAGASPPAATETAPAKARGRAPSPPAPKPAAPRMPALAPIDRHTRHRISRGAIAIDDRIDLHGYTQQDAHDRLLGFLRAAQSQGGRVVLVITGKAREEGPDGRGVLRRAVPHWLASPAFRALVVGFDEAGRRHGAGGALYVRVRRPGRKGAA